MVKCFAVTALLLLFLTGQVRCQELGEIERSAIAPVDIPAVEPLRVSDTLRPRLNWMGNHPKKFLPNPVLTPSLQENIKQTRGLSPTPKVFRIDNPANQPLPTWSSGASINTYVPNDKNIDKGGGMRPSERVVTKEIKEELKFSGQDLKHKIPKVPDIDQLEKEISGLRIGSNNIVNDVLPGEPLRLLPGKVLPDTVFRAMDSLRKAIPVPKGLLQKEAQLGERLKKVAFSNKPKFWDRTYLEGILGLDPNAARIQNISPALGYYLNPKMSLGLGPSVNLANPKDMMLSAVGSRSFLKYELLPRKAYLQAENLSHANRTKHAGGEKPGSGKIDHSLAVGAGYLMSVSNTLSINALVLYNVKQSLQSHQQTSPFNIRLGMSSFKPRE